MFKIALDKQIHLYSVDTGHFYSRHEARLHRLNHCCRQECRYIQNKLSNCSCCEEERNKWQLLIEHKQKKAKESKAKLQTLLKNKSRQNEQTGGRDHTRELNPALLNDQSIVSSFESALTRTIGLLPDSLTDVIIIVQVYYFDLFKDLIGGGFIFRGKRYRYFTSSAGQIRTKKAVFIQTPIWEQHEQTLLCGLTVSKINAMGGNNVNKHLAYMALTNSATSAWPEFDIERSIVIEDFETEVSGTFDFIDETDYSITRTDDRIPITHTDGAGMILPSVRRKNIMFRAPWIKGLLGVFDFRAFIEQHDCSPVIKDIYGQEYNLIKDDIQVIFTRSQFKMHRYYRSWQEYKDCYHQYRCSAGLCNEEEDRIKNARINYQMLQTLTDVTAEEIRLIAGKSVNKLDNLCASAETIKEALGITPYNTHMTPFQQAVKLYPSLINDTYTKDTLRNIKKSLVNKYRCGKLELQGKYTFILPDFYAACEYWFSHDPSPRGLLDDQEVYCRLFGKQEQLDCLRSPHLYKEHAVRQNAASIKEGDRIINLNQWFITPALYTSSHDLISKVLQFDVDGDKALVVADPDFNRIAKRNMQDIVPLHYNMRKAKPTELNHQSIYNGLISAFTGGNIGLYSNDIAKIWNSDVFVSGTAADQQEALHVIKLLCCENNYTIDYAKTLYKPERPAHIHKLVAKYTKEKLPAFFTFAKDKDTNQVSPPTGSLVNKLYDIIPDKPINTRRLKLPPIDYRKMMTDPKLRCTREIQMLYDQLNRRYRYKLNLIAKETGNIPYIMQELRARFTALGYDETALADMLVQYLYGNEKRYKELLWFCFGDYLADNLRRNIGEPSVKYIKCIDCGEWVEVPARSRTIRCCICQSNYRREMDRKRKQKRKSADLNTVDIIHSEWTFLPVTK